MPTQMEMYYYIGVFIFSAHPRFALVVLYWKERIWANGGTERGVINLHGLAARFLSRLVRLRLCKYR